MRTFLIQHVDSVITMAAGVCIVVFAVRRSDQLRASKNRLVRNMHILGLILVGIGIARFAFESVSVYSWRRVATPDGAASAEFPLQPTTETATDTAEGFSIRRVSTQCQLPHKDIDLRLTWSDIPPDAPALTIEQRFEGIKAFLTGQGFVIRSCTAENQGNIPCRRIIAEMPEGKMRLISRIAIAVPCVYQAAAVSSSGFHDDPAIERFIASFSVAAQAPQAASKPSGQGDTHVSP